LVYGNLADFFCQHLSPNKDQAVAAIRKNCEAKNMSMFFRCYGYLSFENEAEARRNYEILTTRDDTWFCFFPKELQLTRKTIQFKAFGNFSSYSTCEKTDDVIKEIAANTLYGSVKIDEGDGEEAMWSWKSYSVSDKQVYREHTDPQKSYRFKGKLEFADEKAAKNSCKTLLTDTANSIFTRFPPNQRIFVDDQRIINFAEKTLHIAAHCPGNEAIYKKTLRLLKKIQSQAISSNVECAETYILRFIPDKSQNSWSWVNNMKRDIFYHYSGSLTFYNAQNAENAYQKLLNDEKSVFVINRKRSFPLYILNGNRLVFDDFGGCRRSLFNTTNDLIEDFAFIAKTGKVEGAFSISETMDSFVVDRIVPSKVRKRRK
jgi:hypothetical protein